MGGHRLSAHRYSSSLFQNNATDGPHRNKRLRRDVDVLPGCFCSLSALVAVIEVPQILTPVNTVFRGHMDGASLCPQ